MTRVFTDLDDIKYFSLNADWIGAAPNMNSSSSFALIFRLLKLQAMLSLISELRDSN